MADRLLHVCHKRTRTLSIFRRRCLYYFFIPPDAGLLTSKQQHNPRKANSFIYLMEPPDIGLLTSKQQHEPRKAKNMLSASALSPNCDHQPSPYGMAIPAEHSCLTCSSGGSPLYRSVNVICLMGGLSQSGDWHYQKRLCPCAPTCLWCSLQLMDSDCGNAVCCCGLIWCLAWC